MPTKRLPIEPSYTYNAKIVSIIDGDSAHLDVFVGFHVVVNIHARFDGINAPEVSTPEGKEARAALRKRLLPGTDVIIKSYKDPGDKYGRWLVLISHEGVNINQWMVTEKLAVPYYG